ncbi:MAG: hypothetical protein ACRDJO_00850 [Actinomycetota bacterium]
MDGRGYLITIWLLYGAAGIGLTLILARTLFRNGAVFLRSVFPGDSELARAVNVLLVVGFFMLNLGYSALLLGTERVMAVRSGVEGAGLLVNRLGVLLVSMGVIHFLNMAVFYRLGRRGGAALRTPAGPPPTPGTTSGLG